MATSSSDAVVVDQIETLLECSICLEMFKNPRTLPCFHTFCKVCLQKYVNGLRQQAAGRKIEEYHCPTCRSLFRLKPEQGVDGLPGSHFIRNMLEIVSIQRRASKCHRCQGPAFCRCITCELFLCEKCFNVHESWHGPKKHTVMSMDELAKPENLSKIPKKLHCQKHDKRTLKFYCMTCRQLICRCCMDFDHVRPDHVCCQVIEVAQKQREALARRCAALEECLKQGNEGLKSVRAAKQSLQDNAKRAKEAISRGKEEALRTFMQKLEEKMERLKNEVDNKYRETVEPLSKQERDFKDYADKVKASLDLTKNLLVKGSDEEIISAQQMINENEEKVQEVRSRSMEPVHNGKMQYLNANDVATLLDTLSLGKIACHPIRGLYVLINSSLILNGDQQYCLQMREWLGDQFQWRLCYRATRDGWRTDDFHRCCDKKGPTVVLVKVGEYIFGGYADQSWAGWGYKYSDSSFLFSLKNKDNLPAFKAVIHGNKDCAIYSDPGNGPVFGGGRDLIIQDNAHSNQHSYTNLGWSYSLPPGYHYNTAQAQSLLAGSYYFTPTELEVFY